jgi:hypothetical protein
MTNQKMEEKKNSLRTQAQVLDFGRSILDDFRFLANTYLKEQQDRPLFQDENGARLLKSLSEIAEAAAKAGPEFDDLRSLKLKEAGSLSLENFEG